MPLLWAAVSLVAAVFSTPLAALSDRWGRVRLLVAGYLAYGVFYLALGTLVQGGPVLFALFAFYGLFMAATEGVEKALVADLAPAGRRGTAYGWFNLTAGAMLLPASVIFGWLYQSLSPLAAFAFSGACALAAALLMVAWVGAKTPPGVPLQGGRPPAPPKTPSPTLPRAGGGKRAESSEAPNHPGRRTPSL